MKKENVAPETTLEPIDISAPAPITSDSGNSLLVNDSRRQSFSSWTPQTLEERKSYYNAINMPGQKLSECVNMSVKIQHIYAETCDYRDRETGEVVPGVRIVLIDDKGKSYNTSSIGVYNCLSKIFQIFGTPNQWTSPLVVKVKQIAPEPNKKVLLLEVE